MHLIEGLKFALLADWPAAVTRLAAWYFAEWGYLMADASEVSIARALGEFRNRDRIPLVVLALRDDAVVGAAQLKFREMKIYPDKEHWLGGVYVDSRHRGQGIGSALVKEATRLAVTCKVELLYLQTQQLDGGMYRRLGWSPVEEVSYHGLQVLVMEKALSDQFG